MLTTFPCQVQEVVVDYTTCLDKKNDNLNKEVSMPDGLVQSHFKSLPLNGPTWQRSRTNVSYGPIQVETDVCSLFFEIPNNMNPPVLLYYRLTNFYQNHRRYVKSLDTDQLKGKFVSNSTIATGSCDPLRLNSEGKA